MPPLFAVILCFFGLPPPLFGFSLQLPAGFRAMSSWFSGDDIARHTNAMAAPHFDLGALWLSPLYLLLPFFCLLLPFFCPPLPSCCLSLRVDCGIVAIHTPRPPPLRAALPLANSVHLQSQMLHATIVSAYERFVARAAMAFI